MGRPREHDSSTGQALLDTAEALLSEGGPDAISVRAVAQRTGTSTRAVYSVFGNKEGLIAGLAERGYRLLAKAVDGIPLTDDPARDLVAVGIQGFRPFALQHPALYRLTFERVSTEVLADTAVRQAAEASHLALMVRIRRAQEAGVIDDRPKRLVSFAFHSLCQGMAGGELAAPPRPGEPGLWEILDSNAMEACWEQALTALIRGMAPGAGNHAQQ